VFTGGAGLGREAAGEGDADDGVGRVGVSGLSSWTVGVERFP